uniref:Uncharacterized protein n=1 Tax=Rhizophora mucronata TaxID=61149 RepID=A0A2P2PQV5_RHIMU
MFRNGPSSHFSFYKDNLAMPFWSSTPKGELWFKENKRWTFAWFIDHIL